MCVSMKNVNNSIQVSTPYNPEFNDLAKNIGGKYNSTDKCWYFNEGDIDLLKNILLSVFGTDGINQSQVNVEITVKKDIYAELSAIYLAGRMIARAFNRDSGAKIGDKISFVKSSPESGGSLKNWRTIITAGAVFRIHDLYEGATKILDECDDIEYRVINKKSSNDDELAKLKIELAKITARIAELEK